MMAAITTGRTGFTNTGETEDEAVVWPRPAH